MRLYFCFLIILGGFYELFDSDARTASEILDIALARRQASVDMAGFPYFALDTYCTKLINHGYLLVICEQESKSTASLRKNKLIQRNVTRIVTPGTLYEDTLLDPKSANYLMSIVSNSTTGNEGDSNELSYGVSYIDVSTGEFHVETVANDRLRIFN